MESHILNIFLFELNTDSQQVKEFEDDWEKLIQ